MNYGDIQLLRQGTGRFDHRFKVGPAKWPHHDLLWINEGSVKLWIGSEPEAITINAPAGLIIFPDTPFHGTAINGTADASINHFKILDSVEGLEFLSDSDGYCISTSSTSFHIQYLVRLALRYGEESKPLLIQKRLLLAILDCFTQEGETGLEKSRVKRAWRNARQHLSNIRTLSDVADGIGLSESAFRRLHRQVHETSAGNHLRELRLTRAEELLVTTGLSVAKISIEVGYAHPESFSAAFSKSRKQTPATYRKLSERFA